MKSTGYFEVSGRGKVVDSEWLRSVVRGEEFGGEARAVSEETRTAAVRALETLHRRSGAWPLSEAEIRQKKARSQGVTLTAEIVDQIKNNKVQFYDMMRMLDLLGAQLSLDIELLFGPTPVRTNIHLHAGVGREDRFVAQKEGWGVPGIVSMSGIGLSVLPGGVPPTALQLDRMKNSTWAHADTLVEAGTERATFDSPTPASMAKVQIDRMVSCQYKISEADWYRREEDRERILRNTKFVIQDVLMQSAAISSSKESPNVLSEAKKRVDNLICVLQKACAHSDEFTASWLEVVEAVQDYALLRSTFVTPKGVRSKEPAYVLTMLDQKDEE